MQLAETARLDSQIINGDCLDVMRTYPDNHFSGIVTDPPYGLSFMNKSWDHGIPGIEYWRECLRICKPGAYILAFGGTRTYHRLTCAIEDAGWEIRDCVSWLYGSGFPKSHNHFGLPGFGTALKPAWEPIIVAMKPCEGTFAQNAEKWGQAGINIEASRIGTVESTIRPNGKRVSCYGKLDYQTHAGSTSGRWPANLILDEEAGAMLDEQSGTLKSGSGDKHSKTQDGNLFKGLNPVTGMRSYNADTGGASRFFYCAKASSAERNAGCEGLPLKQSNPNYGTGGFSRPTDQPDRQQKPTANNHPTVKPIKLMEYLVKLITPPSGALILDPFAGSGTTLLACKNLGVECVGIEKSAEYCEIANARLT